MAAATNISRWCSLITPVVAATIGMTVPALAQSNAPSMVLKPGTQINGPTREQMIRPLPGKPSNPKANTIASGASGPQTLTVRYLTDSSFPVTLMAEGVSFNCANEPGNPTPVTACIADVTGKSVDLSATYGKSSPLTPIKPRVSGKQWNGACAGTAGDTCHVTMSGPQKAGIDFYAKP